MIQQYNLFSDHTGPKQQNQILAMPAKSAIAKAHIQLVAVQQPTRRQLAPLGYHLGTIWATLGPDVDNPK